MKPTENQIKIIDVLIDEFQKWKDSDNIDRPIIYNSMVDNIKNTIGEFVEDYDMTDIATSIQNIFVKIRELKNN